MGATLPDLARVQAELDQRAPQIAADVADAMRPYVPVARVHGGKARDTLAGQVGEGGASGIRIEVTGESYLDYVRKGTPGHEIFGFGHPLRFEATDGGIVFTWHVDHPGTAPNDFVAAAAGDIAAVMDAASAALMAAVLGGA